MAVDLVGAADRLAGTAIENIENAHHVRRLSKLGHSAQRMPPEDGRLWAAGEPPPREGNAIDVLIEGAAYFPAGAEATPAARLSVPAGGLCIPLRFALFLNDPPVLLRELLAEKAE